MCRKLLVEALGREKIVVRRPHAVLERGLILDIDKMPAFLGCEEEEKMEDK